MSLRTLFLLSLALCVGTLARGIGRRCREYVVRVRMEARSLDATADGPRVAG